MPHFPYLPPTEDPIVLSRLERIFIEPQSSLHGDQLELCDSSHLKKWKDLSKILIAEKNHLPTTLVNVHMGYLIWTEGHHQLLLPGKHLVEDYFVGAALVTVVEPEKMLLQGD